tara:strand:+ start:2537 stop:2746 length:210 start_codon:yes stop_codon:yes gene_type:complete
MNMIELVVCEYIRKGYKIVVPKNTHLKILTKYASSIYKSPSDVKPNDKLKFVGWFSASEEDRKLWRSHL